MTDPLGPISDGRTAVPEDQRGHLVPTYIATLGDLYEAEEENIAEGTFGLRPSAGELLDDLYLRSLHKAMFGQVWRWAGSYRQHNTNIGIDWRDVPVAIRDLSADALAWVELATFPPDEVAVRFHHRLVFVHPFVNGNGRHGRFAAEYLVEALGAPRLRWGTSLGVPRDAVRRRYRLALQRMDRDGDDVGELLAFARS